MSKEEKNTEIDPDFEDAGSDSTPREAKPVMENKHSRVEAGKLPDQMIHIEQEIKSIIPESEPIINRDYSLMPDYKTGYDIIFNRT
jgi:hypothetical protein